MSPAKKKNNIAKINVKYRGKKLKMLAQHDYTQNLGNIYLIIQNIPQLQTSKANVKIYLFH